MKCPNCDHDMVESRAGWLCASCGHIEPHPPIAAAVTKTSPAEHESPEQPEATSPIAISNAEAQAKIDSTLEAINTKPDASESDAHAGDTQIHEAADGVIETPSKSALESSEVVKPDLIEKLDADHEAQPPAIATAPWEVPTLSPDNEAESPSSDNAEHVEGESDVKPPSVSIDTITFVPAIDQAPTIDATSATEPASVSEVEAAVASIEAVKSGVSEPAEDKTQSTPHDPATVTPDTAPATSEPATVMPEPAKVKSEAEPVKVAPTAPTSDTTPHAAVDTLSKVGVSAVDMHVRASAPSPAITEAFTGPTPVAALGGSNVADTGSLKPSPSEHSDHHVNHDDMNAADDVIEAQPDTAPSAPALTQASTQPESTPVDPPGAPADQPAEPTASDDADDDQSNESAPLADDTTDEHEADEHIEEAAEPTATEPETVPASVGDAAPTPEVSAATSSAVPAPTPAPSTPASDPVSAPPSPPAAVPEQPTPNPAASTANVAPKPALTPTTKPKPVDKSMFITSVVAGIVVLIVGLTAYFAFLATPGRPFGLFLGSQSTPAPESSVESATLATATPLASPAQSVAPNASASAATRDNQRKADLAQYVTAYRAKASGGYYPVNPPVVNVTATDPTTQTAYVVTTEDITTTGKIHYMPGYLCTGKVSTPGQVSTKNLSITTILESSTTPYCLNVTQ